MENQDHLSLCPCWIILLAFFFFYVRCDGCAKSSGRWLLGSRLSAVVWQLVPRAWSPLRCLLAKTVGVLSPGVGRSEEGTQEFAPQSHIHDGLNQWTPISLDVCLALSDHYSDGIWWFGSSHQEFNLVPLWAISIVFQPLGWFLLLFQKGLGFFAWGGEVGSREFCCCLCQSVCSLCFWQCHHVLAPTGALPCCRWIEHTFCAAVGWEDKRVRSWETDEQTRSQTAGQHSVGCSLPQSGILWQPSGREVLLCSRSSGHQLGWKERKWFDLRRRMYAPLPPFLTALSAEISVKTWAQVLLG